MSPSFSPAFIPHPSSLPPPPSALPSSSLTPHPSSLPADVVLSVRNVSKKFCRNLKRSMRYGLQDLGRGLLGLRDEELRTRTDEFIAVNDISFDLRRGECLGLIGANGSGKSTLLRLINGIFPPDAGQIVARGRLGGLIALGAGMHPHLTGLENVYLNGSILGMTRSEIGQHLDRIIDFADLGDFMNAPLSTYSSGMKVRLGFAVAIHANPEVLLVDEVLAVGDINFKQKCMNIMDEIVREHAVLFVSHSMLNIARIATKLMVLDKGHVLYYGDDVARGIDVYFSKIDTQTVSTFAVEGVAMEDFRLSTPSSPIPTKAGERINVTFGSELRVGATILVDKCFRELTMSVIAYDCEMRPVAEVYSMNSGEPIVNASGMVSVDVCIREFRLNPGTYALHFTVWDTTTTKLLLKCKNVRYIQVVGGRLRVGGCQLNADWTQHR